jgi:hypothetical protein
VETIDIEFKRQLGRDHVAEETVIDAERDVAGWQHRFVALEPRHDLPQPIDFPFEDDLLSVKRSAALGLPAARGGGKRHGNRERIPCETHRHRVFLSSHKYNWAMGAGQPHGPACRLMRRCP